MDPPTETIDDGITTIVIAVETQRRHRNLSVLTTTRIPALNRDLRLVFYHLWAFVYFQATETDTISMRRTSACYLCWRS